MVRVIGGEIRGRRLKVPKGAKIRPTSDKVKESLFNILAPWISGATFLDLFAGTGGVGIEAVSRGASKVTLVEKEPEHLRILYENVKKCGMEGRVRVLPGDVLDLLRKNAVPPSDIVFADPPYDFPLEKELLLLLSKNDSFREFIIYEHPSKKGVPLEVGTLQLTRSYRYGDTRLSFYERKPST
jgi:16S rRNA (guanine(966)-N(2))-methyltransferase RsmD